MTHTVPGIYGCAPQRASSSIELRGEATDGLERENIDACNNQEKSLRADYGGVVAAPFTGAVGPDFDIFNCNKQAIDLLYDKNECCVFVGCTRYSIQ